ncbi:MAG: hypothetical protein AB7I59_07250 [Geminicoccaceae bacterium]
MRCWRLAPVVAAAALLASCAPTNVASPPAFDPTKYPAIRLAVGNIDVSSVATYPTSMGFIARRRSEQLSQDAQAFLRARLEAAGGSDFARATVEEAILIEQPRAVDRGVVAAATQPNWEMAGVLALKVAVVDGLGIEQSYASSRVEIKRSISERASVEAKDDFARTIINDLIAASSTELESSINQNLADRKAP